MSDPRRSAPEPGDLARQALNVFGAIFQVAAGAFVGDKIRTISDDLHHLIMPATYAFSIWGVIFLLLAVYAVYQALPSRRTDPLLRSIGWFTGIVMTLNGVWTFLFPNRLFLPAQVCIIVGVVAAAMAYLRYAQGVAGRSLNGVERWVIGPALGLLFGWLTAATVVGLAATLVAFGLDSGVESGRAAAGIGGAALLAAGGLVAFLAIVTGRKSGATTVWVGYAVAILWALVAVFVEQRADSQVTSGMAVVVALLVVAACLWPLPQGDRPDGRLSVA